MGTDRVELRFNEVLEGDEKSEDLQDPGELWVVQLHSVAEVIITVLLDFAIINHSDCKISSYSSHS